MLTDDWRADEELLLLEGCLAVGLGNWLDISEYIGTKLPEQCENHYLELFLASRDFPLPVHYLRPSFVFNIFSKKIFGFVRKKY